MAERGDVEDRFLFWVADATNQPIDRVYRWRWVWLARMLLAKLSGRSVRRPR